MYGDGSIAARCAATLEDSSSLASLADARVNNLEELFKETIAAVKLQPLS